MPYPGPCLRSGFHDILAGMFEELKKDWSVLRQGSPGHRFEERYRYRRYEAPSTPVWRLVKTVLGTILIPVGIALWFLPGPG